ncbi:ABC transporter permease [Demequina sp. NBRC 110053]|uniref:ABC transporter permease n=1 Tax=Demequina sp. NBRC 110053 TaxID=1570342 RepID=UPI0013566FEB|nr:ABC transporter permease [Demequina sp. NBRC 110053]
MAAVSGLLTFAGPAPFTDWSDERGFVAYFSYVLLLIYAPFLIAVVGGTAAAFRGIWAATRRADLVAELALGRARADLIRSHALAGLREGVMAGAVGGVAGATVRQAVSGLGGEFVPGAMWIWLSVVALAAICLTAAYALVAWWATRGSVREIAEGAPPASTTRPFRGESVPPTAPRSRGRGRRVWAWATAGGVATVMLGLVLAATGNLSTDDSDSAIAIAASVVFGLVLMVTLSIGLPALLVWGGTRAAVRLSLGTVAAVARGAAPGSARALAADAVARPTPMRTGALAAVMAVMGVATVVTCIYAGTESRNALGESLIPDASVSTIDLVPGEEGIDARDAGWVEPLPTSLLEELRADADLLVIEAGVLLTDVRELPLEPGEVDWLNHRDLLIAVDAADVDRVEPGSAQAMYLTGEALWAWGHLGWTAPGTGDAVTVNGVTAPTHTVNQSVPWAGVERAWAEEQWGTSTTAAVLLFPAGDVSVSKALARHDLRGLEVVDLSMRSGWSSPVRGGLVAAVTAPFLAVAVAIVIALAWSTQRLRAKDQATLLALGATPRALRGAAAVEALVPTLIAGLLGVVGGALIGLPLAELANAPLGAAGVGNLVAGIGVTASAMPWLALLGLVIVAAVVAAIGAALVRVRLDRLSPAQQLEQAQKAGIS